MSAATSSSSWIQPTLDGRRPSDCSGLRCRSTLFGALQSYWFPTGQDLVLSKIRVAADYSDSVPDSSKYAANPGYHPLEELKDREKNRDMLLTDAELARTTVEANSNALVICPGMVHCKPHGHVLWDEFQYVIDDYGDIFFEFFEDKNILQDRFASNPVTVLIGMNKHIYGGNKMVINKFSDVLDCEITDKVLFNDDFNEIVDTEVTDTLIKWGMPETLRYIHPLYFSECLTMAAHTRYEKKMDYPSNSLCIMGCLRPAFIDEEPYLRRLFHHGDDDYISDWRDESEKEEEQASGTFNLLNGEALSLISNSEDNAISSLYKLEIMTMELFSVYGDQSKISLQDFQDAEPDVLAHSASEIIEHVSEYEIQCSDALKALCRKRKGLHVEGASLIGVDSLGMDVRVFSGVEAKTLRFSFNTRAMSANAAEKKIKRMLFPRYHRKNSTISSEGIRDLNS